MPDVEGGMGAIKLLLELQDVKLFHFSFKRLSQESIETGRNFCIEQKFCCECEEGGDEKKEGEEVAS